ncbi:limonene-1,2-epoxide hydrolase family protein [Mycolicibacterium brumae]|uniref:Limonene-1,2-epoxide hydrolase n=1 Tax=Mycolicibacterium brumae TaxID=85968 RepID=A0A2G5P431_9MYCO|nr:limonene-1,2-epoxide hydrolase family protein [Mycolicibacterium brumae]MCV7193452.1 nuclear transport factor 2 family protein [Mycolicibacterium brumae]PIB73161.1 limonene-1,2-epoxide hydrolase [Mycolicibacterium brumae]RWA17153.1 hypothetical protein MBRU_05885 [Mycolicibacterium brumae DSM 44177]UWW09275.1 nuclear transport factor 2 family protein [Mycolicibacterium brumae]
MDANVTVVDRALAALPRRDLATLSELFDDGIVYQNVGTPALRGKRVTLRLFGFMFAPGRELDVRVHRSAADGAAVLNERTDLLRIGPLHLVFWAYGVFEVRDGRITLWRDYWSFQNMAMALARGLIGVVIPSRRPRLDR